VSQETVLQKYTVIQPGKAAREFDKGEDAVKHLVEHPGYAQLFAPDGNLLMTKGDPHENAA
jgi:hypothetical protein